MGRRSKTSIIAGATLLTLTMIYALATSIGVPCLVRQGLAEWQLQVPGLEVASTSVSCNPFTLTLEVRRLVIRYAGRNLLAVERIQIRLSSRSLAEHALIFQEITLQHVMADLRWDANGYLDIERIVPRSAGGGDRGSLAWRIDHLALDALRIRAAAVGTLAEPLDVTIPRIELDHIGSRDPGGRFSMELHGRNAGQRIWSLHWQGRVDTAPLASAGHFRLTELSLPWVGQAFKNHWPLQARRGQADVEGDYSLGDVGGRRLLAFEHTTLEIRDFDAVGAAPNPPEVSLRRLSARVSRIDGVQHQVIGDAITLESPAVLMHREPDGDLDLGRLVREWLESGASAARPAVPAWSVSWPLAAASDAVVRLADSSVAGAGEWRLPGVDLRITKFQNAGAAAMHVVARGAGLGRNGDRATGVWSIEGQLQPASSALQAQWRIQDLDLRLLNALPRLRAMFEVSAGGLTASGRIDGNLHQLESSAVAFQGSMHRVALKGPAFGAWSAEHVSLGPVRVLPAREGGGPSRFTAPALRVSNLTWDVERGALHLLGAASDLTLRGIRGDRVGRRVAMRDVTASAGHSDLLGGAHTLHLGWQALEVERASADLAAQRFVAGAVTGTDWSWRGRLPWIKLPTFALADVRSDSRRRQIDLGKIRVGGGRVVLALDRVGAIEPLAELDSLSVRQEQAASPDAVHAPQAAPWRLSLDGAAIRLRSLRLGPGLAPPPARVVSQLALRTGRWSSAESGPLQAHLECSLGGGQWQWDGEFTPRPLALAGQLVVQSLDLPPLAKLLMRDRDAQIDRGSVSLSGAVGLHRQMDSYAWHYAGALQAVDGRIVDGDGQVLASWASASMPTLAADWQSGLDIPRLDLDGLRARITILPDHRINLYSMLPGEERATAPSVPPGPVTLPAPAPWPVHIDELDLARGSFDFEDETLTTPFHAAIHDLTGTIGPLASDAAPARASIQLSGHVNDYGHVDVQGYLAPLQRPRQGDVSVHFSRIELPTLNPYAAQITGYRVDQGMLDLKLHYTLDHGLIDGDNRAHIDQLILGPQVRSGAASDLPLRAIVDILRNARGEIDVDVPIRGSLNDPDFVLRDVAIKALQDALRKTLESPFEFVAALLGRDSEQLRHIDFQAGSAALVSADEEKLRSIGRALTDHQKLLVFIRPTYDRITDASGSQHAGAVAAHKDLRSLALQRGEAIKQALVNAGVREHRILIDEPADLPQAGAGTVRTSLELEAP